MAASAPSQAASSSRAGRVLSFPPMAPSWDPISRPTNSRQIDAPVGLVRWAFFWSWVPFDVEFTLREETFTQYVRIIGQETRSPFFLSTFPFLQGSFTNVCSICLVLWFDALGPRAARVQLARSRNDPQGICDL